MKKTKTFNNLDVSNLKLKNGEVKVFKLLKVKKDPTSPTGFYIPSAANVPNKDVITIGDETVDIAAIRSIGVKGNITFHRLWFTKEAGGTISCHGGRIVDQEIYEYLMLSNFRSGNPNRDPSYKELYKLIDSKSDAKVERATRSQRLQAELYASEMTDEEVLTFSAASGWNNDETDILRNRIETMAQNDPIHFMKIASNRHNNMKADIKRALDEKVLSWDKPSSTFSWAVNGELIVTVPRSTKGSHLDGMINFLVNTEHGEAVYKEIKTLLNGGKAIEKEEEIPVFNEEEIEELETTAPNPKPIVRGGQNKKSTNTKNK